MLSVFKRRMHVSKPTKLSYKYKGPVPLAKVQAKTIPKPWFKPTIIEQTDDQQYLHHDHPFYELYSIKEDKISILIFQLLNRLSIQKQQNAVFLLFNYLNLTDEEKTDIIKMITTISNPNFMSESENTSTRKNKRLDINEGNNKRQKNELSECSIANVEYTWGKYLYTDRIDDHFTHYFLVKSKKHLLQSKLIKQGKFGQIYFHKNPVEPTIYNIVSVGFTQESHIAVISAINDIYVANNY